MNHVLALAAGVALFVVALDAAAATFSARGNEPFWHVEVTDTGIVFRTMDGEAVTVSPKPEPETADDIETYRAEVEGQPFSLTVANKICVDSMSGMTFPKTVAVTHGESHYAGCGGDPASLLHGEWAIEEIGGKPIAPSSTPTLAFDPEGKVSGNGSCNRYFGGYELTGEGLSFSQLGSTKMACEPPLMEQEYVFLQILGEAGRFEIDAEGKLILHGNDGRTLLASRV